MQDLFIKDEKIEKVASLYLDKDGTTWVKSIITEFLTQYPQLQKQPLGVQWVKKDYQKGYGVGNLQILGGNVPIIVNNFQVSPFDIITFGDATIPLCYETLQEMLTQSGAFKGTANVLPKSSLQIFGDYKIQFSPTDRAGMMIENSGTTRDAVKVASIIDKISLVDTNSIKDIFTNLKPDLLEKYELNKTNEVLEKLAGKPSFNKETELQDYVKTLKIDRQFTFQDDLGNLFVKKANSKYNLVIVEPVMKAQNTIINDVNYEKLEKIASFDEKLIKIGESGIFIDDNGQKSAIVDIISVKKDKKLEKCAFFNKIDENGGFFVTDKGDYKEIPKDLVKIAQHVTEFDGDFPKIGDLGVFVINNKVTDPFEVESIVKVAGILEINGTSKFERVKYCPLHMKNDSLVPIENEKNAFYVPKDAYFIKLNKELDNYTEILKLANTADTPDVVELVVLENLVPKTYKIVDSEVSNFGKGELSKNAHFVDPKEVIRVEKENKVMVRRQDVDLYSIVGTGFNKSASLNDTVWELIHCGANSTDIKKVASLQVSDEYQITNKLEKPNDVNKLVNAINTSFDEYSEHINNLFPSTKLVKIAAGLKDKLSVDAVLSLGLMKKYNISEYIQLIPDYERVVGELAKLLLMIRLGLATVDETAVKTAMEALTTTLTLLKQLSKVNK